MRLPLSKDVTHPMISRQLKRREASDEAGQRQRRQKDFSRYRSDKDAARAIDNQRDIDAGRGGEQITGLTDLQSGAPISSAELAGRVGANIPARDAKTGRLVSTYTGTFDSGVGDGDDDCEGPGS